MNGLAYLALAILLLTPACERYSDITSVEKRIERRGDVIVIEGRYKDIAGNSQFRIPGKINTVSLRCYLNEGVCNEVIADLATPKGSGIVKEPLLFIHQESYRIISRSDDIIHARMEARVADFDIRISLRDNFVERQWRETKARGADTSNPDLYRKWVLE